MKKLMRKRSLLILFAMLVSFMIGMAVQSFADSSSGASISVKTGFLSNLQELKNISDTMDIVNVYYDGTTTKDEQEIGALKGILNSLNDPYSEFIVQDEWNQMEESMKGEYAGVGMIVSKEDGFIEVVSPFEGSPAAVAGLLPGDKIVDIEGKTTSSMGVFDAVKLLKGKIGTKVTLTVYRKGTSKPFKVTLTRENIVLEHVSSKMLSNKIGYIRVSQFSTGITAQVQTAIKTLQGQGMQGLILDLRNDPGGDLTEAVMLPTLFLNKNSDIVSVKSKIDGPIINVNVGPLKNKNVQIVESQKDHFFKEVAVNQNSPLYTGPMVVLTNGGSASASEIVAGALKDNNRAELIGEKTYGKALVQQVIPFKNLGVIKLTIAKYYTPNGDFINKVGITPNIIVKQVNGFSEGVIMNKMITNLSGSSTINSKNPVSVTKKITSRVVLAKNGSKSSNIPKKNVDLQLAKAESVLLGEIRKLS